MLNDLQIDLQAGLLTTTPVDWPAVHERAESLSNAHTIAAGHRLADILHVATALHLGAAEFLTFDLNQKKLAEAEGLVVPV
jgi:predicted nucleic acid-binding protein